MNEEKKVHLCMKDHLLMMVEEAIGGVAEDAEWKLSQHSGDMTELEKRMARALGDVYKISHGFNEFHECHHVHKNWCEEMNEKYRGAETFGCNPSTSK